MAETRSSSAHTFLQGAGSPRATAVLTSVAVGLLLLDLSSQVTRGASTGILGSPLFVLLELLLALQLVFAIARGGRPPRQPPAALFGRLGAACLLIASGSSASLAVHGRVTLGEGESTGSVARESFELLLEAGDERAARLEVRADGTVTREQSASGAGVLGLRLESLLPSALVRRRLVPASLPSPPGIALELTDAKGARTVALLAGAPPLADGPFDLEALALDPESLAARLAPLPAPPPRLVLEPRSAAPFVVELPAGLQQSFDCGGGVRAVVTLWARRARIVDGQLVDAPEGPDNPAASVEVHGPGGRLERHTLFARLPEYDVSLGVEEEPLLAALRLEAPSAERPRLSILIGPGPSAWLQTSLAAGRLAARPLAIGEALPVPELALAVALTALLPQAALEREPQPVAAGWPGELPCAQVEVTAGSSPTTLWLPLDEEIPFDLEGTSGTLVFRRASHELPFRLRLEDARVLRRPGGGVAGYESVVRWERPGLDVAPGTLVVGSNRPGQVDGHRIVQAPDTTEPPGQPATTTLLVSTDPGRPLLPLGAALLVAGAVATLVPRRRGIAQDASGR